MVGSLFAAAFLFERRMPVRIYLIALPNEKNVLKMKKNPVQTEGHVVRILPGNSAKVVKNDEEV